MSTAIRTTASSRRPRGTTTSSLYRSRCRLRRPSSVQPDPLARPHPQPSDPPDRRGQDNTRARPRPGDRCQRFSVAPGRPAGVDRALRTQVKRKRYNDRLRDNVQTSIELAITDGLTGLYNRRYIDSTSGRCSTVALAQRPISVMILDIDCFKSINDAYGHDAGDDVLREFALRMRKIHPRHRSRLPLRRRGIRRRDAGNRHGGGDRGGGAPAPAIATEPFSIQHGARSSKSRSRSVSRHCRRPATTRPAFSSAPIMRSIVPSATAATASCRTPPELSDRAVGRATPRKLPRLPAH